MNGSAKTGVCAAALAAMLACILAGCGCRKEESPPPPPPDPVKSRMQDEEYVKQINTRLDARKKLMLLHKEAKANLEAARAAETPDPARIAACEKDLKECEEALVELQLGSKRMVAERMRRSIDESRNNLKQKGN